MRNVLKRLFLIFPLYSCAVSPCFSQSYVDQVLGFRMDNDKKKVEFKFENYNNLIIVSLLLNDVLPVKFILDSGVRTSILTERSLSDFLAINYDRKIPLIGTDGTKLIDAYVASNVTLKLPGATSKGQGMLVLAEDYLQLKNYLGVEVHGILGYELFSRFIVKINYDKTTVTLYNPDYFKPKKKQEVLPLTIEDSKPYLFGNVKVGNGQRLPAKLMMDTGASHSILLDKESHDSINIPEQKIYTTLGRGLGGNIEGFIARVKNVNLGSFEFEEVIGSFPVSETLAEMFKPNKRQGTIGGGLLSKFIVTIDYFNERIYLKKGRKINKGFEYNMSGIEVKAIGNNLNTFVINEITPDSPAERAGLLPGDIIDNLNGHSASNIQLNDVNSFFRTKPGRKINLSIVRDGEKIKKTFKLEKVI
ncbi:aspartyl protease family protein [Fulvivirgaceae bacterium BMA12]|uniref:Aspartyl protease family protein n=1 Tax=Agaribacillus aureus TaxID=3051825 RepID=A0ABT8LGR5_9BACT|nr:aspartyl protease family protein [Fulvivirgaceae bacterium BMA12]